MKFGAQSTPTARPSDSPTAVAIRRVLSPNPQPTSRTRAPFGGGCRARASSLCPESPPISRCLKRLNFWNRTVFQASTMMLFSSRIFLKSFRRRPAWQTGACEVEAGDRCRTARRRGMMMIRGSEPGLTARRQDAGPAERTLGGKPGYRFNRR
jgi:hypothetical protein